MAKSRREFIKNVAGAAAYLMFGGCSKDKGFEPPQTTYLSPRTAKTNPFINGQGQPILVCVDGTNFESMLNAGLENIGGLGLLIDNDQDVLIKPNCNYCDPYPGISSVESTVTLINSVCQTTTGAVRIGDQGYQSSDLVYPSLGFDTAIAETDGELITLANEDVYRVRRDDWIPDSKYYAVYSDVYDAPIIINFCVLKRHFLANMTCSLKSNVGTIKGPEGLYSRDYLHNKSGDSFLREVAEIAGLINPELNIVDARSILINTGPLYDAGNVRRADKLIICGDMVATDAYCATIMDQKDAGFSIDMITPTLERAELLGLGTADLNQVEIREINA